MQHPLKGKDYRPGPADNSDEAKEPWFNERVTDDDLPTTEECDAEGEAIQENGSARSDSLHEAVQFWGNP